MSNSLTRRDFFRNSAGVALATAGASALAQAPAEAKVKVVLIRDAEVLNADESPKPEVLRRMIDEAVKTLTGQPDALAGWKSLIKPEDVVGIKTNVAGPPRTPPELEAIVKQRVLDAGVAPDKVAVEDRGVLKNPIFQTSTALINMRPIHTHHWSGVGSLLKNYLMFSDNPPSWHPDSCANLAGLFDLPIVKGKTRLNVQILLTPLFHGKGPHHYSKEYVWPYKGLLVSVDPVAADATALRILEAKRAAHFGKSEPFAVSPHHIQIAQDKFKLGVADPARIELIKLGWTEDVLI